MSQAEETKPREVRIDSIECQLALRRAIDDVLDDLIIAGADKVSLLENNRNKQGEMALSRSQVRNVVNEAVGKRSREAIINFIRYQMGRKDGDAWRNSAANRKPFGRELIADLEGTEEKKGAIDEAVHKVCESVKQRLERSNLITSFDELQREARAQLIRLYLGYLNRTYAYCEAMDEKGKQKQCWRDVGTIAKRK